MAHGVKERTFGWSATDFDPNTAYDALVDAAAKTWGMSNTEVVEFMAQIEWHESRGDHTAIQKVNKKDAEGNIIKGEFEDGVGRGLFQYEVGDKQGAWTAKRRFANWMDKQGIDVGAIPEDFSRLGPQLQRAIFLADALAKGGDPKKEGVHDWWLAKHWAGEEEDRFDRSQAFIGSMKSKYDNGY